jgi:hypothetical protein
MPDAEQVGKIVVVVKGKGTQSRRPDALTR